MWIFEIQKVIRAILASQRKRIIADLLLTESTI